MKPMKMVSGAMGAAKSSAQWGDKMRKQAMEQHKCFWGGGDQGTLSLRACDAGGRNWSQATPDDTSSGAIQSLRKGGSVTRGSKREKSRLSGKFKIV
jgi:hypothetical protein